MLKTCWLLLLCKSINNYFKVIRNTLWVGQSGLGHPLELDSSSKTWRHYYLYMLIHLPGKLFPPSLPAPNHSSCLFIVNSYSSHLSLDSTSCRCKQSLTSHKSRLYYRYQGTPTCSNMDHNCLLPYDTRASWGQELCLHTCTTFLVVSAMPKHGAQ